MAWRRGLLRRGTIRSSSDQECRGPIRPIHDEIIEAKGSGIGHNLVIYGGLQMTTCRRQSRDRKRPFAENMATRAVWPRLRSRKTRTAQVVASIARGRVTALALKEAWAVRNGKRRAASFVVSQMPRIQRGRIGPFLTTRALDHGCEPRRESWEGQQLHWR